jgi:hypothetical protein
MRTLPKEPFGSWSQNLPTNLQNCKSDPSKGQAHHHQTPWCVNQHQHHQYELLIHYESIKQHTIDHDGFKENSLSPRGRVVVVHPNYSQTGVGRQFGRLCRRIIIFRESNPSSSSKQTPTTIQSGVGINDSGSYS